MFALLEYILLTSIMFINERELLTAMKITRSEEIEIKALRRFFENEDDEDDEEEYIHVAG